MGVVAHLSEQVEDALVGAIVQTPSKLVDVSVMVKPEDFKSDLARRAYVVSLSLWKQKKTVDLVTVSGDDMKFAMYLSKAISVGAPFGCMSYAENVAKRAKDRRVAAAINSIQKSNKKTDEKLDDLLLLYQNETEVTTKDPDIKSVMTRFNTHVSENKKRKSMGISTGFQFLDEIYVQLVQGHIWTMGAYTSVGKTAMMVQMLCNLISSDENPSIVVISTEMTEEQVVARIVSNFTGIHSSRILSGNYRNGEEEFANDCIAVVQSKNLTIYDNIYTLNEIDTAFKKAELQGGVDVGFIDYVQNCRVPEAASEYQSGSMLAKGVQRLAKDVRCTLVCLSQVSNDVGRGNTDQLELKGAGEWAAVSDLGIMLRRGKNQKHQLLFQVKKNRHGQLHEHIFEFKSEYTRLQAMQSL